MSRSVRLDDVTRAIDYRRHEVSNQRPLGTDRWLTNEPITSNER